MSLPRVFLLGLVAGFVGLVCSALASFLVMGMNLWWMFGLLVSVYVIIYCAVGLACAAAWSHGIAPRMMRSGIVMGLIAWAGLCAAVILREITSIYDAPPVLFTAEQALGAAGIWALLCAVVGLLLLIRPRATWWVSLRRATLYALATLSAMTAAVIFVAPQWDSPGLYAVLSEREGFLMLWYTLRSPSGVVLALLFTIAIALSMRRGERASVVRTILIVSSFTFALILLLCFLNGDVVAEMNVWNRASGSRRSGNQFIGGYYDYSFYRSYWTTSMVILLLLTLAASLLTLATLGGAAVLAIEKQPVIHSHKQPFTFTCPRCGLEQPGATGGCHCRQCALAVRLELT